MIPARFRNRGHGDPANILARLPRRDFDEARTAR